MRSSKLYKTARFSDVVIRATTQHISPEAGANKAQTQSTISVASAGDDGGDDGINERVLFQYPAHQQILAEGSDYFAALLENWCHSDAQQIKPVVTLKIQATEVQSAEALLHFLYFLQTPPELNPQELLGLLRLADEYDVAGCLAACVKELTILKAQAWDDASLQKAFQLPEPLMATAACQPLVACIHNILFTRMGNFQEIWHAQKETYQSFLQMPLRYVRELLGSDMLQLSHENTALVALADWVSSNTGEGASDQEIQALGNEVLPLVRLPFLSSSMLGQLLSFNCFSGCKCLPQLLACSLRYKVAGPDDQEAMAAEPDAPLRLVPRKYKTAKERNLRCYAPLALLESMWQQATTTQHDKAIRMGKSRIIQGLIISAMLRLSPDGSMWCRLRWHPYAVSKQVWGMPLRLSLKWSIAFDRPNIRPVAVAATGSSLFANDAPGMSDEIKLLAPSDSPLPRLREHATADGAVRLRITLTHLD